MMWKKSRPQKIAVYAKLLSKFHILSDNQATEIMKSLQNSHVKE